MPGEMKIHFWWFDHCWKSVHAHKKKYNDGRTKKKQARPLLGLICSVLVAFSMVFLILVHQLVHQFFSWKFIHV